MLNIPALILTQNLAMKTAALMQAKTNGFCLGIGTVPEKLKTGHQLCHLTEQFPHIKQPEKENFMK